MTSTHRWHPADGTGLTVTLVDSQVGLRLHGEAEMRRFSTLREAIAALPADADEVHLELAKPNFIDVRSTRELIALARPAPPRLSLHQCPFSLTRPISLLWPGCCQLPVPPGNGTGDSAAPSASRRLADRETKGDARA